MSPVIANAAPARTSAAVRGMRLANRTKPSSSATPMNSEIVARTAPRAVPATMYAVADAGERRFRTRRSPLAGRAA